MMMNDKKQSQLARKNTEKQPYEQQFSRHPRNGETIRLRLLALYKSALII